MDLDATDVKFVNEFLPDDAIATGLFAIVTWMDEDGVDHIKYYNQTDLHLSGLVGLLEMTKLRIIDDANEDED